MQKMVRRSCSHLQWHQDLVQQWPVELRGTYCLAILEAADHNLKRLQRGCVSADTTLKQLGQAVRCAACLMTLAESVASMGTAQQQVLSIAAVWVCITL